MINWSLRVVFKYQLKKVVEKGVFLTRPLGKGDSAVEVMLCKPLKGPQISVHVMREGPQLVLQCATMGGELHVYHFALDVKWRDCFAKVNRGLWQQQKWNDLELFRAKYFVGCCELKYGAKMQDFLPPEERPAAEKKSSPVKQPKGTGFTSSCLHVGPAPALGKWGSGTFVGHSAAPPSATKEPPQC